MGRKNIWTVEFAGDYFTLQTTVSAKDEEQATAVAIELLNEHYGFDMESISNEINALEV